MPLHSARLKKWRSAKSALPPVQLGCHDRKSLVYRTFQAITTSEARYTVKPGHTLAAGDPMGHSQVFHRLWKSLWETAPVDGYSRLFRGGLEDCH
jgi:hypothetical protein